LLLLDGEKLFCSRGKMLATAIACFLSTGQSSLVSFKHVFDNCSVGTQLSYGEKCYKLKYAPEFDGFFGKVKLESIDTPENFNEGLLLLKPEDENDIFDDDMADVDGKNIKQLEFISDAAHKREIFQLINPQTGLKNETEPESTPTSLNDLKVNDIVYILDGDDSVLESLVIEKKYVALEGEGYEYMYMYDYGVRNTAGVYEIKDKSYFDSKNWTVTEPESVARKSISTMEENERRQLDAAAVIAVRERKQNVLDQLLNKMNAE
jgi:hypothetical protein